MSSWSQVAAGLAAKQPSGELMVLVLVLVLVLVVLRLPMERVKTGAGQASKRSWVRLLLQL